MGASGGIVNTLVTSLRALLPDFAERLAIDSHGNPTKEEEEDARRDMDADRGTKRYHGVREDGTVWEKVKRWFGYKLRLIVDANYELGLLALYEERHPPTKGFCAAPGILRVLICYASLSAHRLVRRKRKHSTRHSAQCGNSGGAAP